MRELDDKYKKTYQELQDVSKKLYKTQLIQNEYFYLKNQINDLYQKVESYKQQNKFHEEQINEASNKITIYDKEKNESMILNEERKKNLKLITDKYKKEIEEKNKIIKELNLKIEEMKNNNKYNKEDNQKNKLEIKLKNNLNKLKILKHENDKQKRKIKDLEERSEDYKIEIEKLKNKKPIRNLTKMEIEFEKKKKTMNI